MGNKPINGHRFLLGGMLGIGLTVLLFLTPEAITGNVTYLYDHLQRLIRATYTDGTVIAYSYDQVGNRLIKKVVVNPSLAARGQVYNV